MFGRFVGAQKLDEDALKELTRHTKFKLTEAGTIEISIEDRDPKLAAAMANEYVERLDRFNREVRMTKGWRWWFLVLRSWFAVPCSVFIIRHWFSPPPFVGGY